MWTNPIDVSVTIRSRMPIYPGDPGVAIELAKSIRRGDPANVSRLDMGAHTGTHVDAPRHFLPDGAPAAELPLDPFIGPCVVADASAASGQLDAELIGLLELAPGSERVLLRTGRVLPDVPAVEDRRVRRCSGASPVVAREQLSPSAR